MNIKYPSPLIFDICGLTSPYVVLKNREIDIENFPNVTIHHCSPRDRVLKLAAHSQDNRMDLLN